MEEKVNNIYKLTFYLDKNVIQYIRKPRDNNPYDKLFTSVIQYLSDSINIPYSEAHFRDLMKQEINIKNGRFIYKDLRYIQNLTKGYYLVNENNKVYYYTNTDVIKTFKNYVRNTNSSWDNLSKSYNIFNAIPEGIKDENILNQLEQLKSMPFPDIFSFIDNNNTPSENIPLINITTFGEYLTKALNFSDEITSEKDPYKELRNKSLKINALERDNNNIDLSKITCLKDLDEYIKSIKPLSQLKCFSSFKDMVEDNLNTLFKNQEITLLNRITSSYIMLDMLGIDKEKITDKNLMYNLTTDSMHLYYGTFTNLIISEDQGLQTKGKIIYELYNIKTKIFSISDFINKIKITQIADNQFDIDIKDLFSEGLTI